MDTLDPCSNDGENNDASSLYVEIIEGNWSNFKCTICNRKLLRKQIKTQNPLELCSWQRWEVTQANHNFECDYKSCFTLIFIKEGYYIRKYKRYLDNPSVPVPKSTKLDRNKHSAMHSNTAISIPQSVIYTALAVVLTESSASHNGETFVQETVLSNYMWLQKCIGILVYKWLCTVQSVPKLGKGCWQQRSRVVILYHK